MNNETFKYIIRDFHERTLPEIKPRTMEKRSKIILAKRIKNTYIVLMISPNILMDKLFSSFSQKFSLTAFYKQYKGQFQFSKDLLYRYFSNFVQKSEQLPGCQFK